MKNLENANLKELREMAKEQGVKDWWNMKKVDLIEALSDEAEEVQEVQEEVVEEATEEVDAVEEVQEEIVEEQAEEAKPKKNQKRLLTYNGKTQSLTAWAKELGVRHQVLYYRIVMKGWEVDKAFETLPKKEKAVEA